MKDEKEEGCRLDSSFILHPSSFRRTCFVVESGTDVRLVEGLARHGSLTVLARTILGGREISHPPEGSVRVVRGPASRVRFALAVVRHLLAQRRAYDVVLVQGYGLAALAANLAGRVSGAPTFMLVCSPVEQYYLCRMPAAQPDKPFRRHELWALRTVARLNALLGQHYLTLSHYLAGVVRAHGGRKPVDVVPVYGVDTQIFAPAREPKRQLRARLGLPTEGFLIFFSSRIAPEKDDATLLAAARDLLVSGRDVWLLNCSGGHDLLRQRAEELGIADRVLARPALHPHQELPAYYQASDLCVQASRAEGLGFSPLEALACGVPVVAAATGGLPETIRAGRTGWTYPTGDVAALADCIREVMDDPAEAARRALAGRDLVAASYRHEDAFARLDEVCRRALDAPRVRALTKHQTPNTKH
jgi:glycosyltransferase involved in cell wall biosynthesis